MRHTLLCCILLLRHSSTLDVNLSVIVFGIGYIILRKVRSCMLHVCYAITTTTTITTISSINQSVVSITPQYKESIEQSRKKENVNNTKTNRKVNKSTPLIKHKPILLFPEREERKKVSLYRGHCLDSSCPLEYTRFGNHNFNRVLPFHESGPACATIH